jgi:uncharacterized protein (TIGR00369 family)
MTSDESIEEFAKSRGLGELATSMGVRVLVATADSVVMSMPVDGNRQPLGLLHGGANVVLAESAGSLAANLYAQPEAYAVGVDISATHLKSAIEGNVTATAVPLKLGKTIAVYQIEIRDESGDLTCVSRLTCAIRKKSQAK